MPTAVVLLGTATGPDRAAVQALARESPADSRSLCDVLAHPAVPTEGRAKLGRAAGLPKANFRSRGGMAGEYSEALAALDADASAAARALSWVCLWTPASLPSCVPVLLRCPRSCARPASRPVRIHTATARRLSARKRSLLSLRPLARSSEFLALAEALGWSLSTRL